MKENSNKLAADKLTKTLNLLEETICRRCSGHVCDNEEASQCADVRLIQQVKKELEQLLGAQN